jgi:thiamine pyrophosphate-dependent acetolactate synthase large subunit-like protein
MPAATEKFGSNLLGGNYAALAQALGLSGERVEDPAGIGPAIRRGIQANQQGQPALIEVMTREEPDFSRVSWVAGGH